MNTVLYTYVRTYLQRISIANAIQLQCKENILILQICSNVNWTPVASFFRSRLKTELFARSYSCAKSVHCTDYHVTSLLFLRVTCPCSLRTYATLKFIRSSSSASCIWYACYSYSNGSYSDRASRDIIHDDIQPYRVHCPLPRHLLPQ